MRKLTGQDIIDFYASRYDLLVLDANGEYAQIDRTDVAQSSHTDSPAAAYDYVTTENGDEVQILLERSVIEDGDWFPDALDDEGDLAPSVADEMAEVITSDGVLSGRVLKALDAGKQWQEKAAAADEAALFRARAVAEIVALLDGNQSAAARSLSLDQSTVNRLVKKATTAAGA